MIIFIVTAVAGPEYWKQNVIFDMDMSQVFLYGTILNSAIVCLATIWGWRSLDVPLKEKLRPAVMIISFLAAALTISMYQSSLLENYLVLYLLTTGTSIVRICSQLILSRLCSSKIDLFSWHIILYGLVFTLKVCTQYSEFLRYLRDFLTSKLF